MQTNNGGSLPGPEPDPHPRAEGGVLSLQRRDWIRIALASAIVGMIYLDYHMLGRTFGPENVEASAFDWTALRWRTGRITFGPVYYVLAWAVPLVSGLMLWHARESIRYVEKAVNLLGLPCIVLSLIAHWVGARTEHARLSILSLIFLLWAIPFFLYGWKVARQLIYPCVFLVFLVPLNFLDSLVFRLRVVTAKVTAILLAGLGVECTARNASIVSTSENGFVLTLPSSTAGLGTLLIVAAFAAALAYFLQRGFWRRTVLVLAAGPAYLLANVLVMTPLALVAGAVGRSFVDTLAGIPVMAALTVFSCLLVLVAHWLLNQDYRSRWGQFRQAAVGGPP